MKNSILIAQALLELAQKSKTNFLEEGEISEEIKLLAKKINLTLPSPDLAVFVTTYAEISKPNLNGIILPRKAVEEGLDTLRFKQCNWEHSGKGFVMGYTIDAKIEDDKIITTNIIFKSLFPEQFEELKEKITKGEAAVSFEIWNKVPKTGESVLHERENGYKSIDPIIFHGTGVLLTHKPACPKAKIFHLSASKELIEAEKIVDKVFEEDLVFASLAIEEPKCKNCDNCTCEKEAEKVEEILLENDYEGGEIEEAKKLTTEQRNALPDEDFALIQEKDGKKIRRFPINDEAHVRNALARLPQAKDITEEERKSALEKILKKAKELNMTELLKKYEKAEDKPIEEVKPAEEAKERLCPECNQPMKDDEVEICAECLKKKEQATTETKPAEETKTETSETQTTEKVEENNEETVAETKTEGEETKVEEKKEEAQSVEEVKPSRNLIKVVTLDGTEVTEIFADGASTSDTKRKIVTVRYYDDGTDERNESYEEVVRTYSYAELEEKINALVAEKDAVIETLKAAKEQEIADLKTAIEKLDTEIKNLKDELGKKDQEIAKLQPKDEEPIKDKKIDVGEIKGKEDPEIKRRQKEINTIIAAKHQQ